MKLLSFLFGKAEDGKKLIKYNISQKIKTSQWIPVEAKAFVSILELRRVKLFSKQINTESFDAISRLWI